MAFCEQCGTKLNEEEKFCGSCGTPTVPAINNAPQVNTSDATNIAKAETTNKICANCKKELDQSWLVCPYCKTDIKKVCKGCGKELEKEWIACPYCKLDI